MAVQYPGMKKGKERLHWKKIRIPYNVMRILVIVLVFGLLVGGGSFLWARHQGKESFVGRLLTVLTKKVDERIKLVSGDAEEELLTQRFAVLTFYSGNVEVQRASELKWRGASEKMRLETGDRVRTFGNSRADITFDEGNILRVKPDSLIVIGELTENVRTKVRKSSVKLLVSSIEADIKKSVVKGSQFKLEMPTAVAEVERARLSVNINDNKESQVRVFEGKVGIDTGAEKIELDERKAIMISALKQLTKPVSILPAPQVRAPAHLERFFTSEDSMAMASTWGKVKGARTYRLDVATDRYFDKIVFSKANIQETGYQIPELGGNVFFFRVAGVDARQRQGDYAEPVPFRVIIDRVPPLVEIKKFVVLKSGRSREVLVNGQTEPTATVEIGGERVNVDEQGFFSTVVKKFSPGQEEIEIVVRDRAGNVRSVKKAVDA